MIKKIKITGLLSFGWEETCLELKPLNVLIGPNGSGKSNLIEVFNILKAIPFDINDVFKNGGPQEWIHKGESAAASPKIEIEYELPKTLGFSASITPLRYQISFEQRGSYMMVKEEKLEEREPRSKQHSSPYLFFDVKGGSGVINTKTREEKKLTHETFKSEQSVLSQISDPFQFPEVTNTSTSFKYIYVYINWVFGRNNPIRFPQGTSEPGHWVSPNFDNLGAVLNQLHENIEAKNKILENIKKIYDGITDFGLPFSNTQVQITLHENDYAIPSSRLSDGTLRWLALVTILCHPNPPPIICLEEPELGLHPDLIVDLAKLLIEASKKTTLIITTHSEILIDALSETPESVVVCEKHNGCTQLKRLNADDLEVWLGKYTLGKLWLKGEIGGNRY